MHPKEFMDYWLLSPAEMADLLHCSRDAVYQWQEGRRNPSPEVQRQVRLIHALWNQWKLQSEDLPAVYRELYELAIDRLELKQRETLKHDAD